MPSDWTDLALQAYHRRDYNAVMGDRHYGATEPLTPLACRCESPGRMLDHDDGEVRCWKCGARPTTADPAPCRP